MMTAVVNLISQCLKISPITESNQIQDVRLSICCHPRCSEKEKSTFSGKRKLWVRIYEDCGCEFNFKVF